jgi:hypothetical protein
MARVNWLIKGKLRLKGLPSVYSDGEDSVPLSGVTVKISANEGVRWNSWGTVTTDSEGSFVLRNRKDKSKRKIKVEVQFKNGKTVIYGENASLLSKALTTLKPITAINNVKSAALDAILTHTSKLTYKADWYTLKQSDERTTGGGDFEFNYGHINIGKSSNDYLFEHACIFYACEKLRKHLAKMGHIFSKKIAVKYPHNNKLIPDKDEQSYCSPINNCVYLVKNSDKNNLYSSGKITFNTLYHELMHLWTYGYSKGEDWLAVQLFMHGSTHEGLQKKSYTAFHEAWAEVSSNQMLSILYGETSNIYGGENYYTAPMTIDFLKKKGVTNMATLDRREYGWIQVFSCLMNERLERYDLRSPNPKYNHISDANQTFSKDLPSLDIYDLMQVFRVPAPYKYTDMNLEDFMSRVQKVEPEITNSVKAGFMKVFNPANKALPKDCF